METRSVQTPAQLEEVLAPEDFREALLAQMEVSRRLQVACSMLLLRLEYEEAYVEHYGFKDATELRELMARMISVHVRDSDTMGWFEGGQLAILLRVVSAEETSMIASRLQRLLAQTPMLMGEHNLHLAAQVGGVWYSGRRPMEPEEFISQAMDAMDQ
jgi:diguanylate cyclase (GGDEF)-like protein